ncbi:MAG: hypothetical protein H0V33_12565 [Acidimicrobiia bacterium]|nr:hypothetical protein [Acidimicrobiia bacterium]
MAVARSTGRAGWAIGALPWLLAAQLQFAAARVLFRLSAPLGVAATVGLCAITVIGCWYLLRTRDEPVPPPAWSQRAGPVIVAGFLAAVLVGALVVYPFVDGRRADGSGADVDDAVLVLLDGLRGGAEDPYAVDTYLGNPPASGPGALVWFFPFGTRTLYPFGIVAAVGLLFVLLRRWTGSWLEPGIAALLLAVSVPFWEAVAQGSDHLPFACGLAATAVYFDRRRVTTVPTGAAVVAALCLGALATFRFAFLHVALLVGAALWQQGRRRLGLVVGLGGTAVAVMLHASLVVRSSWETYAPVQQLFTKSQVDLNAAGKVVLAAALAATVVALLIALRRPGGPPVATVLLIGIGGPMNGIALAGLTTARAPAQWSAGGYVVDCLVLAAVVAAAAVARAFAPRWPTAACQALRDEPIRTAGDAALPQRT